MKLLKQILLLTILFSAFNFAGWQDSVYTGKKMHLMKMKGWTLYKGTDKQLVAENLTPPKVKRILLSEANIWWLENEIYIPMNFILEGDIWLSLYSNFDAYEAFINNELIVQNGELNDSIAIKAGKILSRGIVPPTILKSGILVKSLKKREVSKTNNTNWPVKNTIRIKFSNYLDTDYGRFGNIELSSYKDLQSKIDNGVYIPLFLSGFLFLALVVNIAFYFALNRKIVFLLLAALFLCYIFVMSRYFIIYGFNPSVTYYMTIFNVWFTAQFLGKLLLILVLLFEFDLPKKQLVIFFLISLVAMTIAYKMPNGSTIYYFISPVIPFLLSLWALYKKKPESLTITIGIFVLFVFTYLNYEKAMTYGLTIGIMVFAIAMILSFSRKMFNQSKAYQQSLLKSSILENQLLQKHIQPHFLMNSLMSLQELIDVDQEKAGEMIDLLSKEFHLLATFSKQKLISLEDELEICKIHLTIMGYQQRAKFELKTSGIDGDEYIPPAVLHTLVENGLTHGYAGRENGYFELQKIKNHKTVTYKLFNDGKTQGSVNKKNTGLGLKYVEARLEESYPGCWELKSKPVENGWEAIIEIGCKS